MFGLGVLPMVIPMGVAHGQGGGLVPLKNNMGQCSPGTFGGTPHARMRVVVLVFRRSLADLFQHWRDLA